VTDLFNRDTNFTMMDGSPTDHLHRLARQLFENDLHHSARTVIESIRKGRTAEIISLLDRIEEALNQNKPHLPPRLYFVVTIQVEGQKKAIVLPIWADLGHSANNSLLSPEAKAAVAQAQEIAKGIFRNRFTRDMSCFFPLDGNGKLVIDGGSLGLAAALSFVQRACNLQLRFPVIATGRIDADGCVLQVDDLQQKISAALGEIRKGAGMVLVPGNGHPTSSQNGVYAVQTFQDALRLLWEGHPQLDPNIDSIDQLLRQVAESDDYEGNLKRLDAWIQNRDTWNLQPADFIRLRTQVMIQLRHMGRTEDAEKVRHELQEAKDAHERYFLDPEHVQEIEIQLLATTLDSFPGNWYATAIRQHLKDPKLRWPNRIRLQGLLAMYESMCGNGAEAVRLREENIRIHAQRSDLKEDMPETLCHLVWECARAGMRDEFWKYAQELDQATQRLDAEKKRIQRRYNAHAITAGMVLLGDFGRLEKFLSDPTATIFCLDHHFRTWCLSSGTVLHHPEISTLRALMRMHRRSGHPHAALALGNRFSPQKEKHNLTQFLFWVCQIEKELARWDAGDRQPQPIRELPENLDFCHAAASRFYAGLLQQCKNFDGTEECIRKLEIEMDRLYY